MRGARSKSGLAALLVALPLSAGCSNTTDTLGFDRAAPEGPRLLPLTPPSSYPNPFRDVLNKSDAEIDEKIELAFKRLFGDGSEAIYIREGDQAYIWDFYHNDIRTEGMGWAMMICVELDKHDEFDRLWAYAKSKLMVQDGPNAGYFRSRCDTGLNNTTTALDCLDPFGHEQFAMALLFANERWATTGRHNYAEDALRLFDVMLNKEQSNGGVVEGVTNMFDAQTRLPVHLPDEASQSFTRPSLVMPGYYELWAQATREPFWSAAADAGRSWLRSIAGPKTGLTPVRAELSGTPVAGWDQFGPEAYRTQLNLTLDWIWFGKEPSEVENANRQLTFFAGLEKTGRQYSLDGNCLAGCMYELSLVFTNGITATIATDAARNAFVKAVWETSPPTGNVRYYGGLVHLLALLVMGGRFQVL